MVPVLHVSYSQLTQNKQNDSEGWLNRPVQHCMPCHGSLHGFTELAVVSPALGAQAICKTSDLISPFSLGIACCFVYLIQRENLGLLLASLYCPHNKFELSIPCCLKNRVVFCRNLFTARHNVSRVECGVGCRP